MAFRANFLRRFNKKLRGYSTEREGVTSIEFALLSIPYFLIITAIIEIGMIALSSATMQTGVREAGRLTRVGLGGCLSANGYRQVICENSVFLPECTGRLKLKRETFSTGWENAGSDQANDDIYQNVNGGDVVLMTAIYDWEVLSPMISPFVGDGAGTFEFTQSFAFQTEGWETERCRPEDS